MRKGEGLFDMFVAKDVAEDAPFNDVATRFYRSNVPAGRLPDVYGVAVMIEGIMWDDGKLEPRHYKPDYEGEN